MPSVIDFSTRRRQQTTRTQTPQAARLDKLRHLEFLYPVAVLVVERFMDRLLYKAAAAKGGAR